MLRNKGVLAVLFVCCFRLFTAFLIKDETSKFNDTSFNVLPEHGRISNNDFPDFFDWRVNGGVTPVKDQGKCAACWAFSAIASIESQIKIHRNQDIILSEQFLIDCNSMQAGCSPVNVLRTYADIINELGGVLRYKDYPSYEENSNQCRWNHKQSLLEPVIGMQRLKPGDEQEMMKYLFYIGPLSAAINAATMRHYPRNSTIDQPTPYSCPNDKESLDHAVLIVGYDTWISPDGETRVPYWIIKNSWGTDWGDGGFYYLERGTNACGIANDVGFAVIPSNS